MLGTAASVATSVHVNWLAGCAMMMIFFGSSFCFAGFQVPSLLRLTEPSLSAALTSLTHSLTHSIIHSLTHHSRPLLPRVLPCLVVNQPHTQLGIDMHTAHAFSSTSLACEILKPTRLLGILSATPWGGAMLYRCIKTDFA